jgi:hypothetical protein
LAIIAFARGIIIRILDDNAAAAVGSITTPAVIANRPNLFNEGIIWPYVDGW